MGVIYSGSYTKTHMAIATALRGVSANNEYYSEAFNQFLNNIPIVASASEHRYVARTIPTVDSCVAQDMPTRLSTPRMVQ